MRIGLGLLLGVGTMLGLAFLFGPHTAAPPIPPELLGSDQGWLTAAHELEPLRIGLMVATLVIPIVVLGLLVKFEVAPQLQRQLQAKGWHQRWLVVACITTLLVVLLGLATLPVNYLGLLVRRQYGLSDEATMPWLFRQCLTILIGLPPTLVAAEGFYWLLRMTPRWWWLWASLGTIVLSVALAFLDPLIITPLFYRQTPLANRQLREQILQLGSRIGIPINEVYVIDASKQGNEGNAYFTGVGGSTRVVLYDTLVATYPQDELLTVIAHELGHWQEHHVWKGLLVSAALAPLGFLSGQWAARRWLPRWSIMELADVAGLPALLLALTVIGTLGLPVENALSRRWEAAADRVAVAATKDPTAVARTFVHLARQNLSNPTPARLTEGLFATHPAIGRRVAAVGAGPAHP